MPAQLTCPQCQCALPVDADAAVCPHCQSKSPANSSEPSSARRSKRSSRIVASRPHSAPPGWAIAKAPEPEPELAPSAMPYVVGVGVLLIAAVATWAVWTVSQSERFSRPADGGAPVQSAIVSTPPVPEVAVPELAIAKANVRPVRKVRVIDVDAPPEMGTPKSSSKSTLPPSTSAPAEKVDPAIQRGVEWLRSNRTAWLATGQHALGNAALPGLALLESGVEPTDPLIQNVAKRVRDLARRSQATYEISLAILFLDRLADPADGPMIRSLAARLIAGQSARAGWTYQCRLADDLETPLLTALDKMRPQMSFDKPLAREAGKGLLELKMPLAGPASDRAKPLGPPAAKSPVMPPAEVKMAMAFERPEEVVRLVRELPEALRHLPVFETPEGLTPVPKGKGKNRNGDGNDDNSNTQFAMLGLWTAHRHGVPVERSLLLADQRFAKSQQTGGGWGYQFGDEHAKASMTCVGLLGLAVGHGAMLGADKKASGGIGDDPAIRKGLTAVSRSVGSPNDLDEGKLDLYTLWSIERVGVLYGLTTIGGKDWYGWGANRILRAQNANGSWHGNGYHGSTTSLDTAFALLFLRRSNLVQDLTDRLQLHMPLRASP